MSNSNTNLNKDDSNKCFYKESILSVIYTIETQYNLTQRDIADIMGISQSNFSKILSGTLKRYFTITQLITFAKHFNLSMDYLLGYPWKKEGDLIIEKKFNPINMQKSESNSAIANSQPSIFPIYEDSIIPNVKWIMKEYNLTQAQLADYMDMSASNICTILNGSKKRHFTLRQIVCLSRNLHISVDQIITQYYLFTPQYPVDHTKTSSMNVQVTREPYEEDSMPPLIQKYVNGDHDIFSDKPL